jgi:hypothetical protein
LKSLRPWVTPTVADFVFVSLVIWLFVSGTGWANLLADGDTGWHIRTGEYILDTGSVPHRDIFSFSKPDAPWLAWEWLSDVIFAVLHRHSGLPGVVVLSGLLIAISATLLFRYAVWRGADIFFALIATLLAVGASSVHYLARPHVFTLVLFIASVWLVDRDREKRDGLVWVLVPVAALWANLHGGFLALFVLLATASACSIREQRALWRYLSLTAACAVATLANPYGYRLHVHAYEHLASPWIMQMVDEFQSPKFRSEGMLDFEILLFAALALGAVLIRRKDWLSFLQILFWAQAALGAVRHVPLFAIVGAPVVASECTRLCAAARERWPRGSVAATLHQIVQDFSRLRNGTSLWAPACFAALVLLTPAERWPDDFPMAKFPVAAVNWNQQVLSPSSGTSPRIFTTDQWGDYLLYRFYPKQKVFVDGRCDFYGPSIGGQYLSMLTGKPDWQKLFAAAGFDLALLPADSALAEILKHHPGWDVRYDDGRVILLDGRPRDVNRPRVSAEGLLGGAALNRPLTQFHSGARYSIDAAWHVAGGGPAATGSAETFLPGKELRHPFASGGPARGGLTFTSGSAAVIRLHAWHFGRKLVDMGPAPGLKPKTLGHRGDRGRKGEAWIDAC